MPSVFEVAQTWPVDCPTDPASVEYGLKTTRDPVELRPFRPRRPTAASGGGGAARAERARRDTGVV
jgi:hypothetical protein